METNSKKSIKLKNRTNYFDPKKTRTMVTISSPNSYQNRQMKIEGYETRLYWQFRYCEDHNGQTFFYTLTYNDAHIPNHYGVNCFDYDDLRYLFTGGFRKQLLRKYGTTFKYFVGAELGDGKGSRGMHNNPHYHVLFFLEPAGNEKYPYRKIDPTDFRHLVRMYWQGFDESVTGYQSYNNALFGIAREGENLGKVTDFRACMYCAKYVCKDVKLKQTEDQVLKKLRFELRKKCLDSDEVYKSYFKDVIYEMYNTPYNPSKTQWCFTDEELINVIVPGTFEVTYNIFGQTVDKVIDEYKYYVQVINNREGLWNTFYQYVTKWIEPQVKEGLNEWRNRYCNKCRISQGVGDYALQFIKDKMEPTIQVPSKKGFKNRPIGMYYYRRLFCDVVKDKEGSNLYLLNELGQKYKLHNLPKQIKKLAYKAENNVKLILDNPDLYQKMLDSDVNVAVSFSHKHFLRRLDILLKGDSLSNICKRYAEFKLVYEDRFFELQNNGDSDVYSFPDIDIIGDYKRFLVPSFYSVSRNDLMLDVFLEDAPEDYLSYNSHPYFLRYLSVFHVLDMCADYFFVQKDDKSQREAEERAATKRFHDRERLRDFYSQFI